MKSNVKKYSEVIMGDVNDFLNELLSDENVTITNCKLMGDGSYLVEWAEGKGMGLNKMDRETTLDVLCEIDIEECNDCPLQSLCNKEELFWSCVVWEESMGEDL